MFKILVVFLCLIFCIPTLKRFLSRNFCVIDFAVVFFFLMQVLPIFVEMFYGIDQSLGLETNIYYAISDSKVNLFYCIYVLIVNFLLGFFAKKSAKKSSMNFLAIERMVDFLNKKVIQKILTFVIFLPLVFVIISPNPSIYFSYINIWQINTIGSNEMKFFHNKFIFVSTYMALLAILLKYCSIKKNMNTSIFIIIAGITIMTWFDGKRALFIISMLGILLIDILKGKYKTRKMYFIVKIIGFIGIIFLFFSCYKVFVGKLQDTPFITDYTYYLSRMSSVKLSIYSELHGDSILEYRGQTFIFNLFFFVPSSLWKSKPSMYTQYFTMYAINYDSFPSWNLHVNIWAEMISNFGIFYGTVMGIFLTILIDKLSKNSKSFISQISGIAFISLYYMFGFEIIVMIVYFVFVLSIFINKVLVINGCTKNVKTVNSRLLKI